MKKIQKGFTLIELMIVVAIIGILAAVAIPAYQDYIVKSKLSVVKSTVDPIKMAFALYYQENGSFPGAAISTTTAPAAGNAWYSVGLFTTPSLPAGVASISVDGTANTNAGPIKITYTFAATGIKAATIDTLVLQELGTASSTAIDWTCDTGAATTVTDKVALKYFKCI